MTSISETQRDLISHMADGRFYSGVELGRRLGISRSAIWKALQQISVLGIQIDSVKGRGYRLATRIELLNPSFIAQQLAEAGLKDELHLQHSLSIDSTNRLLKDLAQHGAASGTVCLTEHQSQGRGRRGRHWHSPFGTNLYLSLLWRFEDGMSRLATLSLAVAVALIRGLERCGAEGVGIKWPNDIVTDKGKLAGILIDVAGESSGPCYAVIGIGVNYEMPAQDDLVIGQPWTDLQQCGVNLSRNQVVIELLRSLYEVLRVFERQGFAPLREEWLRNDKLLGRQVSVSMPSGEHLGVARGIDTNGMLQLEQDGTLRCYAAGEVSLRAVQR